MEYVWEFTGNVLCDVCLGLDMSVEGIMVEHAGESDLPGRIVLVVY